MCRTHPSMSSCLGTVNGLKYQTLFSFCSQNKMMVITLAKRNSLELPHNVINGLSLIRQAKGPFMDESSKFSIPEL